MTRQRGPTLCQGPDLSAFADWHQIRRRYKHLHGKCVVHPVDGRRLPIVCDAETVDMELGTGAQSRFVVYIMFVDVHLPGNCPHSRRAGRAAGCHQCCNGGAVSAFCPARLQSGSWAACTAPSSTGCATCAAERHPCGSMQPREWPLLIALGTLWMLEGTATKLPWHPVSRRREDHAGTRREGFCDGQAPQPALHQHPER